ncbi:MAG: hypothetical protein VX148_13740 [Pseudomonadota bacterium]|nr:hypothetical protein [Pseudomonadota bacterium]
MGELNYLRSVYEANEKKQNFVVRSKSQEDKFYYDQLEKKGCLIGSNSNEFNFYKTRIQITDKGIELLKENGML